MSTSALVEAGVASNSPVTSANVVAPAFKLLDGATPLKSADGNARRFDSLLRSSITAKPLEVPSLLR